MSERHARPQSRDESNRFRKRKGPRGETRIPVGFGHNMKIGARYVSLAASFPRTLVLRLCGPLQGLRGMLLSVFCWDARKVCPRCSSGNVSRCGQAGVADRLMGVWGSRPFHCSRCYGRFYRHVARPVPPGPPFADRGSNVASSCEVPS